MHARAHTHARAHAHAHPCAPAHCAARALAHRFFGLVYLSSRDRVQDQVQVRAFYLMFTLGIPAQFMMVTIFSEFYIARSVKREVKDGMYHPTAAAIASWVVQAPFMFVLSASAVLPTFVIGDLPWESLPLALLIHACMFWAFEGLAQSQVAHGHGHGRAGGRAGGPAHIARAWAWARATAARAHGHAACPCTCTCERRIRCTHPPPALACACARCTYDAHAMNI